MATNTADRPVRLIRVRPNPMFLEPKDLPIQPLTQAPIRIEPAPDAFTPRIHREDFKDIDLEILEAYAEVCSISVTSRIYD